MPKVSHEAVVQIVRDAPSLLLDLLWPEGQGEATARHLTQTEFVDTVLAEYRADDPEAVDIAAAALTAAHDLDSDAAGPHHPRRRAPTDPWLQRW
jgi:hypothetical protein